ncbi:MAG: globin family protein [Methyloligellaceae bacterium]
MSSEPAICVAPSPERTGLPLRLEQDDVALVRASFSALAPALPLVAELFFRRLYALEPELARTFPGTLEEQKDTLTTLLTLTVSCLDRLEDLYPKLKLLAAKGRDLYIGPYYYGAIGEALLWTLQEALQDRLTPEARDAWTSVYGRIAEIMTEGA